MSPQRIQRKRTKGWRMPEGAVYVGRPTKFGNPWSASRRGDAQRVVERYRRWLTTTSSQPFGSGVDRAVTLIGLHELAGRDLACWCPLTSPCHADVLLELATGLDAGVEPGLPSAHPRSHRPPRRSLR